MDGVQRIEELPHRQGAGPPGGRDAPVIGLVEQVDADRVEREAGQVHRHRPLPRLGRGAGRIRGRRLRGLQDAAAHRGAARHAVDPADAVAGGLPRLGQPGHEAVQVGHPALPHLDRGGGDPAQPEADMEDQAGQPDASDGGGEQVRPLGRGDADLLAGGQHQVEPQHMVAEAADAVVVLAVDVVGDGPADGGEGGSRRGRRQEAPGQESGEQVVEGDAGLAHQGAVVRVERNHAVQPLGQQDMATVVQGGVAVAPAQPAGQDAVVEPVLEHPHRGGSAFRPADGGFGPAGTAPAGQGHRLPGHDIKNSPDSVGGRQTLRRGLAGQPERRRQGHEPQRDGEP